MKKRKGLLPALFPLVLTISIYLIFYSKIDCKPDHVGFWLTLALGMSLGVVLTRFFQWLKDKNKE